MKIRKCFQTRKSTFSQKSDGRHRVLTLNPKPIETVYYFTLYTIESQLFSNQKQ